MMKNRHDVEDVTTMVRLVVSLGVVGSFSLFPLLQFKRVGRLVGRFGASKDRLILSEQWCKMALESDLLAAAGTTKKRGEFLV